VPIVALVRASCLHTLLPCWWAQQNFVSEKGHAGPPRQSSCVVPAGGVEARVSVTTLGVLVRERPREHVDGAAMLQVIQSRQGDSRAPVLRQGRTAQHRLSGERVETLSRTLVLAYKVQTNAPRRGMTEKRPCNGLGKKCLDSVSLDSSSGLPVPDQEALGAKQCSQRRDRNRRCSAWS